MIKTDGPKMCQAASHLMDVLDPARRRYVVKECIDFLQKMEDDFDAIAMSGYSMALIAPTVADALGKDLIIVRKHDEYCASDFKVEGVFAKRYIIIDDLICSGNTIKRIMQDIADYHYVGAKCVGIYLYVKRDSACRVGFRGIKILNGD